MATGGNPRAVTPAADGADAPSAPATAPRGAVTVDVRAVPDDAKGAKAAPPSLVTGGDVVEGLDIAFDRLSFTVPGRRGSGGIQILREACGYAAAGRLTAMQGPSGAGKVGFWFWGGRLRCFTFGTRAHCAGGEGKGGAKGAAAAASRARTGEGGGTASRQDGLQDKKKRRANTRLVGRPPRPRRRLFPTRPRYTAVDRWSMGLGGEATGGGGG